MDQFGHIIVSAKSAACVLNGLLYVRGNSKELTTMCRLTSKQWKTIRAVAILLIKRFLQGIAEPLSIKKIQLPRLKYSIDY